MCHVHPTRYGPFFAQKGVASCPLSLASWVAVPGVSAEPECGDGDRAPDEVQGSCGEIQKLYYIISWYEVTQCTLGAFVQYIAQVIGHSLQHDCTLITPAWANTLNRNFGTFYDPHNHFLSPFFSWDRTPARGGLVLVTRQVAEHLKHKPEYVHVCLAPSVDGPPPLPLSHQHTHRVVQILEPTPKRHILSFSSSTPHDLYSLWAIEPSERPLRSINTVHAIRATAKKAKTAVSLPPTRFQVDTKNETPIFSEIWEKEKMERSNLLAPRWDQKSRSIKTAKEWGEIYDSWDRVNQKIHLSTKAHIQKICAMRNTEASVHDEGTWIYILWCLKSNRVYMGQTGARQNKRSVGKRGGEHIRLGSDFLRSCGEKIKIPSRVYAKLLRSREFCDHPPRACDTTLSR